MTYINGCAWIVGPNQTCGRAHWVPPKRYFARIASRVHIALCEEHNGALHLWRQSAHDAGIASLYQQLPETPHVPGWTYIIRLDDGHVKIGYTARDEVRFRLMELHKKLGRVEVLEVLGVLRGGWTLESVLHHQWARCRVLGRGERFEPNDAMSAWLDDLRIDPEQQASVDKYYEYVPKVLVAA